MLIEDEVVKKIKQFALREEEVRAVIFNGSRVNKNAPIDIFQDYDVCMVVNDPKYYKEHQEWIREFGELVMMQHNRMDDNSHIYLMLFTHNVRIDMSFYALNQIDELLEDSLSVVLIDKDNQINQIAPPSETSYLITKPNETKYNEITNEFWWCLNNVAKGIYRDELPYVKEMYDVVIRSAFNEMVKWYIGTLHNFNVNTGKFGKWVKRYLPIDIYEKIVFTYRGNNYDEIWESIFTAGEVFRMIGQEVASYFNYRYPLEDDLRMTEYLKFVQNLIKTENLV